jgi:hypothetical protein
MPDRMENEQGNVGAPQDQALIDDPKDTSGGKHLLLMVPDFTGTKETGGDGSSPLNSYIRLGMAHSQAGPAVTTGPSPKQHGVRTDLGEDLASLVLGFTDDTRDRGSGRNAAPGAPVNAQHQDPPQGDDYRVGESARLHSKGGWRDHSDGNRITTTRGDKVEVIRGNYKLLVLGRQDDVANVAGQEFSGGQLDTDGGDLGYPNGSSQHTVADQQGLNMSWVWDGTRWHVTTLQGSAGASSNPTITTKTWAYDVDSETTANTMTTSVTTQGDFTSTTTTNAGSINTSLQSAAHVNNTTNANGTVTNYTSSHNIKNETSAGSNILNTTNCGSQETFQLVGMNIAANAYMAASISADVCPAIMAYAQASSAIFNEQVGGLIVGAQQAGIIVNSQLAAIIVNAMNGMITDTHAGVHLDIHAGMHADVHSGIHMEVHGGAHVQAELGPELKQLTGPQVQDILGPDVHIKTLTTEVTDANVTTVCASYLHM